MNNRNKMLAGLLVVQLVLVMILFWRNGETLEEATLLAADLKVEQIDRIVISDEEGKTISLRKLDREWQVEIEKEVWYPVDEEKVEALLVKLAALQSTHLVTRTRASHGRLKVADDTFRRSIRLSGGKEGPQIIYLGSAPNYKSIHVRVGGDDNVYLVKNLSAWEVQAEPGAWWRTSYFQVDPEALLEVGVHNENGEFLLARDDMQGEWFVKDSERILDKEKLINFLDDVSGLSVTDILLPSMPAPDGKPLAVLSLKSGDDQVELKVWEKNDENDDHPVKFSKSTFYAMAGRYAVDALLEISINDLK